MTADTAVPAVELRDVSLVFGGDTEGSTSPGLGLGEPDDPGRPVRRRGRSLRLRQDDDPEHARRSVAPDRRHRHAPRQAGRWAEQGHRLHARPFSVGAVAHCPTQRRTRSGARRGASQEASERAQRLLERVNLGQFADKYPSQLSQGMRQRAAIARTFAIDPDLWLMDEPFGALDAQTRLIVQMQFLELWAETGKTVILVTHDLEEATLLADRVIVIGARPGYIKSDTMIDIARPRNIDELRFDQNFADIEHQIWKELRDELSGPVAEAARPEAMFAHEGHEPAPVRRQAPRFDVSTLPPPPTKWQRVRRIDPPVQLARLALWSRSLSCGTSPSNRSGSTASSPQHRKRCGTGSSTSSRPACSGRTPSSRCAKQWSGS